MEVEDIDEPDGAGGGPPGPGDQEAGDTHGEGGAAEELEEEEEEVVTLDAQRIFLLMRKEYRSRDNRTYRTN